MKITYFMRNLVNKIFTPKKIVNKVAKPLVISAVTYPLQTFWLGRVATSLFGFFL